MKDSKESYWKRIRFRYRLTLLNIDTLQEIGHVHISRLSVFVTLTVLFLLSIGLLSVLIIYTPIRNILPGYDANTRQALIDATARVDSLQQTLESQTTYLHMMRAIVAGDIQADSVPSLDSLQIIDKEQLLHTESPILKEFIEDFEDHEKDNLLLLEVANTAVSSPQSSMFAPMRGAVLARYNPAAGRFGVTVQAPAKTNVKAVMDGVVVFTEVESTLTNTIIIQHTSYVSVYRHVGFLTKHVGDALQTGETIALTAAEEPIVFEIWQNGKAINPEELIVF